MKLLYLNNSLSVGSQGEHVQCLNVSVSAHDECDIEPAALQLSSTDHP